MKSPHMRFLSALFADKPDESFILIWTLPDKHSEWFKDLDRAGQYIDKLQGKKVDVYVGLGLAPGAMGPHTRGLAKTVQGITCLWADMDFTWSGSKPGKKLPPDEAAVRKILDELQLDPSIVVHSGHGLQCYWRFKEPWIFKDDADRQAAMDLSVQWQQYIRHTANRVGGWTFDSVGDLSRVFRVPGTTNYKDPDNPIPVQLDHVDEARRLDYTAADLALLLPDPGDAQDATPEAPEGGQATLTLAPGATPPFEKFQALAAVDARFVKSWNRTRTDLADASPSGYDLSLASLAALAHWDDQEIVNLLIASRRKHGEPSKLREDYYQRTIRRSRETVKVEYTEEILGEIDTVEDPVDRRGQRLTYISDVFQVEVTSIVKYLSHIPSYRLETGQGNIHLGDVSNLIVQPKLRNSLAAAAGKFLPFFKNPKWTRLAQALLDVCVDQEVAEEETETGRVRDWIDGYLATRHPTEDVMTVMTTGVPYFKDGCVHINVKDLKKYLVLHEGEKVTLGDITVALTVAGYNKKKINLRVDGMSTSRMLYANVNGQVAPGE